MAVDSICVLINRNLSSQPQIAVSLMGIMNYEHKPTILANFWL